MNLPRILLLTLSTGILAQTVAPAQEWIHTSAPSNNWQSVACSADGNTIVAQAGDGIYFSTNSGIGWTLSSGTRMDALAISADGTRWSAVNGGTYIYTSTNWGASWIAINAPTQQFYYDFTLEYIASSADGKKLIVGSPVYTSSDSGLTWRQQNFGAGPLASSADGMKLFAANGVTSLLYISTNAGSTWLSNSTPGSLGESIASSADGNKLALMADRLGISISTNMGSSWTTTTNTPLAPPQGPVAVSADGSKLIASVFTNLLVSLDSGMTWTGANTPDGSNKVKFVAVSADGNEFIVAVDGGGIWKFQTTPSPSINLALINGNLMLSWRVPSTNFILQQSFDLSNWANVTNAPILDPSDLENEVILPVSGNGFYRLKAP